VKLGSESGVRHGKLLSFAHALLTFLRHRERSEAIQPSLHLHPFWIASSLRSSQ